MSSPEKILRLSVEATFYFLAIVAAPLPLAYDRGFKLENPGQYHGYLVAEYCCIPAAMLLDFAALFLSIWYARNSHHFEEKHKYIASSSMNFAAFLAIAIGPSLVLFTFRSDEEQPSGMPAQPLSGTPTFATQWGIGVAGLGAHSVIMLGMFVKNWISVCIVSYRRRKLRREREAGISEVERQTRSSIGR